MRLGAWIAVGVGLVAAVVVVGALILLRHPAAPAKAPTAPAAAVAAPTAPAAPAPASTGENTIVTWAADKDGDPKTYTIAGLTLTLSSRSLAAGGVAPVLRVTAADGRTFEAIGQGSPQDKAADFGVGRLDPSAQGDEVIFANFTGGAHCCETIQVLELIGGGWRAMTVGSFNGDSVGAFPTDVDGDGVPDFVEEDDNFDYAFTDHADSVMPPQIFNVVNDAVVDVSGSGRYASLFRDQMNAAQASCAAHNNGACAAYVADASRIGLHDQAWAFMLAHYDATAQWAWPVRCLGPLVNGDCPKNKQQTYATFPAALQPFLLWHGYLGAIPAHTASAGGGPSFSCAAANTAVLKLICATPALAKADRDLQAVYGQALAHVPDPGGLRTAQRGWLAQRDATPPTVPALSALYAARIQILQPLANE